MCVCVFVNNIQENGIERVDRCSRATLVLLALARTARLVVSFEPDHGTDGGEKATDGGTDKARPGFRTGRVCPPPCIVESIPCHWGNRENPTGELMPSAVRAAEQDAVLAARITVFLVLLFPSLIFLLLFLLHSIVLTVILKRDLGNKYPIFLLLLFVLSLTPPPAAEYDVTPPIAQPHQNASQILPIDKPQRALPRRAFWERVCLFLFLIRREIHLRIYR